MQNHFTLEEDFRSVERALFYLAVWNERGKSYLIPSNGAVRSPGTAFGEDRTNFGSLGYTTTWIIRPTSSLLKRSNLFNKGGRTRKVPLGKLYTAARTENLNLNLTSIVGAVLPWKFYIDSYLNWRCERFPPEAAVVHFILLVGRLACNIFHHRPPKRQRPSVVFQSRSLRISRK